MSKEEIRIYNQYMTEWLDDLYRPAYINPLETPQEIAKRLLASVVDRKE